MTSECIAGSRTDTWDAPPTTSDLSRPPASSATSTRGGIDEYGISGLVLPPGNRSHTPATDAPGLRHRRVAAVAVADELRALIDNVVATEVPVDRLDEAARLIARTRSLLSGARRSLVQLPLVDDLDNAVRMYNPACGRANPIAPPMTIETHEGGVVATCRLGLAYEGPPMFGHGGASALLLDQLLGHTAAAAGYAALTTGLRLRYLRPVPLEVPLRLTARFVNAEHTGRRASVQIAGTIATQDEPERDLVTAVGDFAPVDEGLISRIFDNLRDRSPDLTE